MSDCEHQYRRDVESCPYCELNEAEVLIWYLERERDEARDLAWLCLNKLRENAHVSGDLARILAAEEVMGEFIRRCPWLKERPTVDQQEENHA